MTPCLKCKGELVLRGGWMGPTREAPFPRVCPCTLEFLNRRERQVVPVLYAMHNYPRETLARLGLSDLGGIPRQFADGGLWSIDGYWRASREGARA